MCIELKNVVEKREGFSGRSFGIQGTEGDGLA